ncbi:MAG: hypothetical protein HYY18_07185, partial [Planctomycetes bacterium]|nr:hypothetical protein [Planctomycetota bacterium]
MYPIPPARTSRPPLWPAAAAVAAVAVLAGVVFRLSRSRVPARAPAHSKRAPADFPAAAPPCPA